MNHCHTLQREGLSMRVIAGEAKGIRLVSPSPGMPVRPTLDRVRESVFNILAPRLADARFLDLFAGTGANGIEALSRGAVRAVLVDADSRALALAEENLERTRLKPRGTCLRLRLPGQLSRLTPPFDLVYADPPHDFEAWPNLFDEVERCGLVAPGGLFILEHDPRQRVPEQAGVLLRARQVTYGKTTISFFS